jgi:thiol-disulfide isomerase/thioredoxin
MVVNFWAAWCGPCRAEMPAFQQASIANQGAVDFLGIQVGEEASVGQKFLQEVGATYPMGRDPKGTIMKALGGTNLPRTALIAADGTIVAVHRGELTQSELQELIDEHFGG